jgi:hypothetical protein
MPSVNEGILTLKKKAEGTFLSNIPQFPKKIAFFGGSQYSHFDFLSRAAPRER